MSAGPANLPGPARRAMARVAAVTGLPEAELYGSGRTKLLAEPRFAVMLVLRELGWSTGRIGAALGGRDHSSVLHGIKRAEGLAEREPAYAALLGELRAAVRDVSAFAVQPRLIPPAPPPPPPPAPEPKPDPEEREEIDLRRRMAASNRMLVRALRDYRRLPAQAAVITADRLSA